MSTKKVVCSFCGEEFDKDVRYIHKSIKRGQNRHFCSREHSLAFARTVTDYAKLNPKYNHLIAANKVNELSPFRVFIKSVKQRVQHDADVTLEYLKEVAEKQNYRCPISGRPLLFPTSTGDRRINRHPDRASLDRIDNSKGYVVGNVRFITYMANVARNSWSDEEVIDWCKDVAQYNIAGGG